MTGWGVSSEPDLAPGVTGGPAVEPFRVALVGPSRVGKTTLLTSVLQQTEKLLAGLPVALVTDEVTANRVARQEKSLRRAVAAGEFDAAALAGTDSRVVYEVTLRAGEDPASAQDVPFRLLDFPGRWLDPAARQRDGVATHDWNECEQHMRESVMLLVPVDAAVLMEARTPAQRGSVPDLLGVVDVERIAKAWARSRNEVRHRDEPAVLVLAPLKCEKYFDDNGGRGTRASELRERVRQMYRTLLEIVHEQTPDRPVRVVYAPIDTYGCVELMEAHWSAEPGADHLGFTAHYRFRGRPPVIRAKAAATIMQELGRCILAGQASAERAAAQFGEGRYSELTERKAENKGFWGALLYHLSGEGLDNRMQRHRTREEIAAAKLRREHLQDALARLASVPPDSRVEEW